MANRPNGATILAMMTAWFAGGDFRAFGVSSAYTYSTAHAYLSDVTNIITGVASLSGAAVTPYLTTSGAYLRFNGFTLPNVVGSIAAVYFYDHNGGSDAARRLISYVDTGTGLPTSVYSGQSVSIQMTTLCPFLLYVP